MKRRHSVGRGPVAEAGKFLGRCVLSGCVAAMAMALAAGSVSAGDAPSNAELYKMILELKKNQQALMAEAEKAKAEAAQAKAELSKTRQELERARRELADLKKQPAGAPAKGAMVAEAHDPGLFVKVENTIVKFHQEGGVADASGASAEFGHEWAPRLELGYVGPGGLGIRGRYWKYEADENSTDGDTVSVDTYYADLEIFQRWQLGAKTELEGALGVRYLNFEESFPDEGFEQEFKGWGGTVALQGKRALWIGDIYARGRFSLIMGDLEITPGFGGNDGDDDPVYQTELAMGYEVGLPLTDWGDLKLNVGFEWQHWSNVAPGDTIFGGVGNDDVTEDVGFYGVVFGLALEF